MSNLLGCNTYVTVGKVLLAGKDDKNLIGDTSYLMSSNSHKKEYSYRLGKVVRQGMGELSYRQVEALTGVSHATIRRLILNSDGKGGTIKSVDTATLEKLAPFLGYSVEQLRSLISGSPENPRLAQSVAQFVLYCWHFSLIKAQENISTAEDAMLIVEELSDYEALKLAQKILARLVR